MTDTRIEIPYAGTERELLEAFLEWHRQTLALKCSGLTDAQLRERSVPPSSLSLLGLVRHMADVERGWARRYFLDEDAPAYHWSDASPDGDFDEVDTADRAEAFTLWETEAAHSRAAYANLPLETLSKAERHGRRVSLRWILIHLIEEYARHNGHADLLRERIDGETGE
ncbi:DinB family protein [Nonomuraea sp. NPDC050556]|uniref:DinB family protein n=1 Tax=Nonomuraea sp. NPDC050556 TaxID=3364369 RepID=UPI0037895697